MFKQLETVTAAALRDQFAGRWWSRAPQLDRIMFFSIVGIIIARRRFSIGRRRALSGSGESSHTRFLIATGFLE
jgi:hypothetical protein